MTQLTWYMAYHSCIFTVTAILNSETGMGAFKQTSLSPVAGHVIIVDWTTAFSKVGIARRSCGFTVTKLPTYHAGISDVPTVITHSAPCVIVVDFYTSFVVT